jgi:hypothetical protein
LINALQWGQRERKRIARQSIKKKERGCDLIKVEELDAGEAQNGGESGGRSCRSAGFSVEEREGDEQIPRRSISHG